MNKLQTYLTLLLVFCINAVPALAQDNPVSREERIQKIKNAKIAYITEKLNLTSEQAQKFWPVYNQYEEEKWALKRKSRVFRDTSIEALSDQQVREGLNRRMAVREEEVALERQYMDKFLKVISVKQVALLYRSEREFTKVLLQKLDTNRQGISRN
ncbi:hypothetical protein [Adhaeribacter aquaticus]|uniref:hypothetical protein n=1 Tax=Adhaeribacter aquaticus TaxID=299567 RepID=UPI0003FAD528|nr:hypothetical protein [Adhaeribacter aquaticus]